MSKVIETSNAWPLSPASESGFGQDLLTEVLRKGARELLAQAVEQEVHEWLQERTGLTDERGRQGVVRNGHLPERTILTGIGPVEVRQPRVRDRRPEDEREEFSSKILPPYLRKTKSLDELGVKCRALQFAESPGCDFASFDLMLLGRQEPIAKVCNRQPVAFDSWIPSRVKVVGLRLVQVKGLFPTVTRQPLHRAFHDPPPNGRSI